MKRKITLLLLVLVMAVSATASAKPNNPRQPDRHRVERNEKNHRNDRYERNERHHRNDRYERNERQRRHNERVERKAPPARRWDHPAYRSNHWRQTRHHAVPFTWHQHRDRFYRPGHVIERIYDYGWTSRFPGLYPYRWHARNGAGFWYQGRHITDAVMFYDNSDQLVSIGFMHNGTFLFIRDDDHGFENRDSFFLAWRW